MHLTFAETPQKYQRNSLCCQRSKSSSRSVAPCLGTPCKCLSRRVRLEELGAQPFGFHNLHHSRGYKSLISPAAHQRLERLSQRSEELCQRLSGWRTYLLPLIIFSSCLPPAVICTCEAAHQIITNTGEGAGALGQQELTSLNVELGENTAVVESYRSLCSLQAELRDLEGFAHGPDEDMRQLAAEEEPSLLAQVVCHCQKSRFRIKAPPVPSGLPSIISLPADAGLADTTGSGLWLV